jgi:hypothetical protein
MRRFFLHAFVVPAASGRSAEVSAQAKIATDRE